MTTGRLRSFGRWLMLFGLLLVMLTLFPSAAMGQGAAPNAAIIAQDSDVFYLPNGGAEQTVPTGAWYGVSRGGRINVSASGLAVLRLANFLQVRIFRNSGLDAVAVADPGASALTQMRLRFGTVFNRGFPQAEARRYLAVTTDGAEIYDLGTEYLVYYNPETRVTWVVVTDGRVEVRGAGQSVIVPAGWQTWVEPNQAPEPIRVATRAEVGDRFPSVEALTGGALADGDVLLTAARCRTATAQGLKLNLRAGPGFQYQVLDTMPTATPFAAIGRSAKSEWVFGASPDRAGWAYAPYLQCDQEIAALPVRPFPAPETAALSLPPLDFAQLPSLPGASASGAAPERWCYVSPYDYNRGLSAGESTTLFWKAEDASQLYLDDEAVSTVGQRTIAPDARHTYTFRAVTPDGERQFACTVDVKSQNRRSSTPARSASVTLTPVFDGTGFRFASFFSNGATLQIGPANSSGEAVAFMRFDLSAIPTNATITSAKLTVTQDYQTSPRTQPMNVAVYRVVQPFNPGGVGNSVPQTAGSPDAQATFTASQADVTFDVLSLVKGWLAQSNNGLALETPDPATAAIFSRLGASPPRLIITYMP